jgi:hypothetical protein
MKAGSAPGVCIGRVEARGTTKVVVSNALSATVPVSARIGSFFLCVRDNDALFPIQTIGNLLVDLVKAGRDDSEMLERLALDEMTLAEILRAIGAINPSAHSVMSKLAKEIAESVPESSTTARRISSDHIQLDPPILAKRVRVAVSPDGLSLGFVPVYNGGSEVKDSLIEVPGFGNLRPYRGEESVRLSRKMGTNWFRGTFNQEPPSDEFANPAFLILVRQNQSH